MNEVIIMQSLHPKIHDILRFQKCQKNANPWTQGGGRSASRSI
jgi:hypothetical protein